MQFVNMNLTQFKDMVKRGNKFHAKKTVVDGIKFDSKFESQEWQRLCLLEKSGKISNLQRQVKFILQDGYTNNQGKKIKPIYYYADFQYIDNEGKIIVEDTKSPATKTEAFKIKKKLFEYRFPEYIFIEKYKNSSNN